MASTEYIHKLRKAPPELTLTVRFVETPEYKIRKWIAVRLIALASMVLGCGLEVQE